MDCDSKPVFPAYAQTRKETAGLHARQEEERLLGGNTAEGVVVGEEEPAVFTTTKTKKAPTPKQTKKTEKKRDLKRENKRLTPELRPLEFSGEMGAPMPLSARKSVSPKSERLNVSGGEDLSTEVSSSKCSSDAEHKEQSFNLEDIVAQGKELAFRFDGECFSKSTSVCKGKSALKFKCLNLHTFFLTFEQLQLSVEAATSEPAPWCYKCQKFYESCSEVAAAAGLEIISQMYDESIILRCFKRGHRFSINYNKKLQTLACADCKRAEREEWKEQIKAEEAERNERYRQYQQTLFEQAKSEMNNMPNNNGSFSGSNGSSSSSSSSWQESSPQSERAPLSLPELQSIEQQINAEAKRRTVDFMSDCDRDALCTSADQIYLVYKFVATPPAVLEAGM